MFNGAFSPIIQTPHLITKVDKLFEQLNNPLIFAGGTHIMRCVMDYPNVLIPEIIDIKNVSGLDKFVQTEKYIEIGAVNTIQRVKELGDSFFPSVLKASLSQGAPEIVKRKATIGGAIAVNGVYYNLVAALVHLGAMIEVHYYTGKETVQRTIPLSTLYDSKAPRLLMKGLITKVILPQQNEMNSNKYSYYREVGSPVEDPSKSFVFVGSYEIEGISNLAIDATVLFSDIGFYKLSDKNQVFRIPQISSFSEIKFLGESYRRNIEEKFSTYKRKPDKLRVDKCIRVFEDFLLAVNERLT